MKLLIITALLLPTLAMSATPNRPGKSKTVILCYDNGENPKSHTLLTKFDFKDSSFSIFGTIGATKKIKIDFKKIYAKSHALSGFQNVLALRGMGENKTEPANKNKVRVSADLVFNSKLEGQMTLLMQGSTNRQIYSFDLECSPEYWYSKN